MDILIKSFNRVYYLDKCLHSISRYLKNFDGKIFILDDGTPQVYLDKILERYPNVIILKSDNFNKKATLILNGERDLPNNLPVKLWYEAATLASDYFIVLEDDFWFTSEIDCFQIEQNCLKENIGLLKLSWIGNPKVIGTQIIKEYNEMVLYKPKIKIKNPFLFRLVYTKYNRIWRKLLTILGIYSKKSELNYYSIYSVAGALFKKDYFLSIWKDASSLVNEKQQLMQGLVYYKQNKVTFGRTINEVLRTGFISSAFMKKQFSEFTIHDFNATLNKYWLTNNDIFISNLNSDISMHTISDVLIKNGKSLNYVNEWEKWVSSFKMSYINIGCKIE